MKKSIGIFGLSWKSMRYNKRKTIFTILTVSLAVCMMMVILQYLSISRQSNMTIAALDTGAYHTEYENLSKWQLRQLKENRNVQMITPVPGPGGTTNVQLLLKSNVNCKNVLKGLENRLGLQENQINWNIPYLDAADIGLTAVLQILCILLGIFLSAAIVINNIFQIYVLSDIHLFGTMRAAGFEDRQLKRFLRTEGIITGCAGSLAGILLGIIFSAFLIPILEKTESVESALKISATLKATFGITALSFLSGLAIVLLGIQKPLARIAKMSVMETINYYPDSDLKPRGEAQKPKNRIRIWDLCRINLSRNRKKSRWVVLSLVTTGVLFLVMASIIGSMDLENMLDRSIRGDYSLQLVDKEARNKESNLCLDAELIRQIGQQEGVKEVHTIMYDRLTWESSDARKYMQLTEEFRELGIGYEDINSVIYGYDDSFMEACLEQLSDQALTMEEMRDNNNVLVVTNGLSDFRVGDIIHLKIGEGDNGTVSLRIAGILKDNITYRGYSGAGNDFILHQNRFEALDMDCRIKRAAINVKSHEKERVKEFLTQCVSANEYLELESHDELMHKYAEQKNALETGSYSLLALLFCISAVNLFNTSLSNILSRRREIGMLEAVGLTKAQENRLFQMEGLVLILASGVITILLGIPCGYLGYRLFSRSATYALYQAPVVETFVLLLSFVIIQIAVTQFAIHRLGKNSIMEKISREGL